MVEDGPIPTASGGSLQGEAEPDQETRGGYWEPGNENMEICKRVINPMWATKGTGPT